MMLRISQIDRIKFEKSIASGYIEYFNTGRYYDFLKNNDLLSYDDDAISFFKNKSYASNKEFRLVLSKGIKNKYTHIINPNLLYEITSIINPKEFNPEDTDDIENDKLNVIALIGFIYFESVDSNLDMGSFVSKLNILKYFAQQQLDNKQNKFKISIDDYQCLKDYPRLFCTTIEDKTIYKSKEEIIKIINNVNQITSVDTFSEACAIYQQQVFGNSYKKI